MLLITIKLDSRHKIPTISQDKLAVLNAQIFHGRISKLVRTAPEINENVANHFRYQSNFIEPYEVNGGARRNQTLIETALQAAA